MFGVYTKAILSALAALAALISAATAFYANNSGNGAAPPIQTSSSQGSPGRVHGAPGPEMGVAGLPVVVAAYGLYLVARRRKQKQH
jgi:hypothetical protein